MALPVAPPLDISENNGLITIKGGAKDIFITYQRSLFKKFSFTADGFEIKIEMDAWRTILDDLTIGGIEPTDAADANNKLCVILGCPCIEPVVT